MTILVLDQKLDFITKGLSFKAKGSYNSAYTINKQGKRDRKSVV